MKSLFNLSCIFSKVIAPVLTGTGILLQTLPSEAATFAFSEASVIFQEFTHGANSAAVETQAKTSTILGNIQNSDSQSSEQFVNSDLLETGIEGSVFAEATSDALFFTEYDPPFSPFGFNATETLVGGEGNLYRAFAKGTAKIVADFTVAVAASELFSFNFISSISLETQVDRPTSEGANANSNISLLLLKEGETPDSYSILDTFFMSGELNAGRFQLPDITPDIPNYTENFSISTNDAFPIESDPEFFNWFVEGSYSRRFESETNLRLVEFKHSQAFVQTPEPSITFVLLGLGGLFGWCRVRRGR